MKRLRIAVISLTCASLLNWVATDAADTIYHYGSILTIAGDQPTFVEALAVDEGKIVFAGNRDSALAMKSETTRVVDLEGKALLPGFLDEHSHYINCFWLPTSAICMRRFRDKEPTCGRSLLNSRNSR